MFPISSVLYKAVRFPGQGNAVFLGPLASRDPGKVHHGATMQMHNNAAAASTTSSKGQTILV